MKKTPSQHTMYELLGWPHLSCLPHVVQQRTKEGVAAHSVAVADHRQVAAGSGDRHIDSPLLCQETHLPCKRVEIQNSAISSPVSSVRECTIQYPIQSGYLWLGKQIVHYNTEQSAIQ